MKTKTFVASAAIAIVSFGYGYVAHRNDLFPSNLITRLARKTASSAATEGAIQATPPGHWRPVTHVAPTNGETRDEFARRLGQIGYLDGYEPTPSETGVLVHHAQRCFEGVNLYTSGHGCEVVLMDMDGVELHTWKYDVSQLWSEEERKAGGNGYFRRALVYPNGDALAIYYPRNEKLQAQHVLLKLDRNSNLIWSYAPGAHHDLEVLPDGRILLLTQEIREDPSLLRGRRSLDDFVTVLDPDGQVLQRVSIIEALQSSKHAAMLVGLHDSLDVLHTNTVEMLDGRLAERIPAFRAGNVLVSALHLDALMVVDLDAKRVEWSMTGMWRGQHQPTVLENGNLMVFDNRGGDGFSRVVEFDPVSQEVDWIYAGDEFNGFFSETQGSAARLPNGNTLITESNAGRAIEVTPEHQIVWEFMNPRRAGVNDELIAILPEVVRLGPEFETSWAH